MKLADSHCHIDLPEFDHDRTAVLEHCLKIGINRLLVPGLSLPRMTNLIALKQQFSQLDICAGFHPYFLSETSQEQWPQDLNKMIELIRTHSSSISAIGECGLDGSIDVPMDFQHKVLSEQVILAQELELPLILHHRKSHNELIRLLKRQKYSNGGVIHAFSGSAQIAQTYVDMGFYLGIGGTITYERANKTIKAIKSVGPEHLLLETDAPDMPLCGFQGQRNSPTQLILVADKLAQILDVDVAEIAQRTYANYSNLVSSVSTS